MSIFTFHRTQMVCSQSLSDGTSPASGLTPSWQHTTRPPHCIDWSSQCCLRPNLSGLLLDQEEYWLLRRPPWISSAQCTDRKDKAKGESISSQRRSRLNWDTDSKEDHAPLSQISPRTLLGSYCWIRVRIMGMKSFFALF